MTAWTFIRAGVVAAATFWGSLGLADSLSGSYLAARRAGIEADFKSAVLYYSQALLRDPSNGQLLEALTQALVSLGDVDRAVPLAERIESSGAKSQLATMAIFARAAADGDFDLILSRSDDTETLGPLTTELLAAWSDVGNGNLAGARERLDQTGERAGLLGFARYHKALVLASAQDFAGALQVFEENPELPALNSRRAALTRIEVLSQLGRNADAMEFLDAVFGADLDPGLKKMRDDLDTDAMLDFSMVRTPRDGFAEVFFSLAAALRAEAEDHFTLLYSSIAEYLRPDHVEAVLLSAGLLENLEQYDLAINTYDRVPPESFAAHVAALGRADALHASGRTQAAIDALVALTKTYPEMANVHATLGDAYRRAKQFDAAVPAYDQAIELQERKNQPNWFVFYTRAIALERLGIWDRAEADFRRALELNPEQPQVLNYLGYSLVEKRSKLPEALNMIERAAAARPDSGYIIDSLGWVLYRLGRYDEAVEPMERASELEAVDPIVNDHLGDVYWAVGRKLEARFQWRRALSFITDDTPLSDVDPQRIRRKLEVGLDAVLEGEGAKPLHAANEG